MTALEQLCQAILTGRVSIWPIRSEYDEDRIVAYDIHVEEPPRDRTR